MSFLYPSFRLHNSKHYKADITFRPETKLNPLTKKFKTNSTAVCCVDIFFKITDKYRGADKSLARPTSVCILFDGENISFDASLVIYE